jgi:hypothetical protein
MNLGKGIDLPHHYVKGSRHKRISPKRCRDDDQKNLQNKALLRALR